MGLLPSGVNGQAKLFVGQGLLHETILCFIQVLT